MKLSTRGRYGTRFMLDLALHYGEGTIFLKDIASRQDISEKYLGHLILPLKNAGLIHSSRGAHGGYMLAKDPAKITLREVVEAVEGSLSIVECVDNPKVCPKSQNCVNREVWAKLSKNMIQILGSMTLMDLVEQQEEKAGKKALHYYI